MPTERSAVRRACGWRARGVRPTICCGRCAQCRRGISACRRSNRNKRWRCGSARGVAAPSAFTSPWGHTARRRPCLRCQTVSRHQGPRGCCGGGSWWPTTTAMLPAAWHCGGTSTAARRPGLRWRTGIGWIPAVVTAKDASSTSACQAAAVMAWPAPFPPFPPIVPFAFFPPCAGWPVCARDNSGACPVLGVVSCWPCNRR